MSEKNTLSDNNLNRILIELNKIVDDCAEQTALSISNGDISSELVYPPNNGFNKEELSELEKLKENPILESALRKIIADSSANSIFMFLSLIDQVGDPETGEWDGDGIGLVDLNDNFEAPSEMLHDGFFEKYWDWKEIRNKKWSLDTYNE